MLQAGAVFLENMTLVVQNEKFHERKIYNTEKETEVVKAVEKIKNENINDHI